MVKNLKKLRTERGISQLKLAESIGISQQSINKYESQKTEPDIKILIELANFFNTSVDYLIGNSDINRKSENVTHCDLNQLEMNIIIGYRKLSSKERQSIELIIENYLS